MRVFPAPSGGSPDAHCAFPMPSTDTTGRRKEACLATWVKRNLSFRVNDRLKSSVIGFSIQFTRDKILFTYYELAEITTKREPFYGIKLREQIWESSFDEIKGRPWGSGIGDVQADLNLRYNFNGFTKINDMNAHNQYLQFLLTYGVVFTGIILLTISRLLIGIIRKKEFLLLYSWGVLLLFSVSESILQRQWGVIIFAFILNFSIFRLNKSK